MKEYLFNVEAAQRYGVDAAIFLHSLAFWVEKNRANGRHLHAGRYWSYNSQKALAELFPFWTRRQLERIIAQCKDDGALLTGRWGQDPTDRTTWYTLTDEALRFYAAQTVECNAPNGGMTAPQGIAADSIDDPPFAPNDGVRSAEQEDGPHQTVECNAPNSGMTAPQGIEADGTGAPPIAPNGGMQCTERGDGSHQTVECNKEQLLTQFDNTPHTPQGGRRRKKVKTVPEWKPERFARFWEFYAHNARGENRQGAVRAWDKLKADDALIAAMGQALVRQVCSEDWRRGIGIPYASTWLNQRRWEDVPRDPDGDGGSGGWADDPEVL